MDKKFHSEIIKICDNIRKYRELKGYTRQYIAAEISMSASGYGKMERGEVDLTISRLLAIAEVFEIDLSQLLELDVKQIFNVSNNNYVQALGAQTDTINFSTTDQYIEKYIKVLEEKVKSLEQKK